MEKGPILKIEVFSGGTLKEAAEKANTFFNEHQPCAYHPPQVVMDNETWQIIVPTIE